MNRLTVSALTLIASSLTLPAFAAEPAHAAPKAPAATAKATPPAAKAPKADGPKADATKSDGAPTEADASGTEEPAPRESDSLLPNDHKEAPREPERPLVLRKSPAEKPLELTTEKPSDSIWWKLAACGAIVGGAAFLLKKRGLLKSPEREHSMTILGRTAIGVRSELLLVDVDGQKLLLGVTPSSISRLAVMPVDGMTPSLMDAAVDPVPRAEQEPGFDVALDSAREKLEEFAARMKSRAPESPARAKARASRHEGATRNERASRHESARTPDDDEAEYEREVARREAARARARTSQVERELKELRASRPEVRGSRPDLGEQAQSLMRLRQARGR